MKILRTRALGAIASAAALSLVATPAMARGWGHHRDNDDAAWIVGGIVGIGMIAALASAASKGKRDRDVRERDYRGDDRDYRGDDYQGGYRGDDYRGQGYRYGNRVDDAPRQPYSGSSRGIDSAVDACVIAVERGSARVDTVDSVDREGPGWRVTGSLDGGRPFDCAVDAGGRIRNVTVDGRAGI